MYIKKLTSTKIPQTKENERHSYTTNKIESTCKMTSHMCIQHKQPLKQALDCTYFVSGLPSSHSSIANTTRNFCEDRIKSIADKMKGSIYLRPVTTTSREVNIFSAGVCVQTVGISHLNPGGPRTIKHLGLRSREKVQMRMAPAGV